MKENRTTALPRRQFLQAISAGLLWSLIPASANALDGGASTKSVFRLRGRAWVNGKPVDMNTVIQPNDIVKTGHGSELVFVVGDHAILLRGRSHLVIEPHENNAVGSFLIGGLRLFAGKPLYIYGKGRPGQCIHPIPRSPVSNHSDEELIMAEALVGRLPPFTEKP